MTGFFTDAEEAFLQAHEIARLATCAPDGWPHLVPVSYILQRDVFYTATDYGTRKLGNIRRNPRVAVVVDEFRPRGGVLVQARATIIERGPEFRRLYPQFHRRFAWVRADPWGEGEAPFIQLTPERKTAWGRLTLR